MAATDQPIEQNKRIALRIPEELATNGDIDLIDELYAADAVEHDPFGEHRGRTAIRESMVTLLDAFPDFSATVEEIIAEGDVVAMRVTLRGTHEGKFMGVEPTGRTFEIENSVFTRLEDGMVVERWVQPDTLGLIQQLGIEPGQMEQR